MYDDMFGDWKDVQDAFRINDPEPEKVFIAYYHYEDYEGDAYIVYFNEGKYYTVSSGHCSCYGLEDTWEAIEHTYEEIVAAFIRRAVHDKLHKDLLITIENFERNRKPIINFSGIEV